MFWVCWLLNVFPAMGWFVDCSLPIKGLGAPKREELCCGCDVFVVVPNSGFPSSPPLGGGTPVCDLPHLSWGLFAERFKTHPNALAVEVLILKPGPLEDRNIFAGTSANLRGMRLLACCAEWKQGKTRGIPK